MSGQNFLNISFYHFCRLPEFKELRAPFRVHAGELGLKGTILLSPEGINGFFSGSEPAVRQFMQFINNQPKFGAIAFKESWSDQIAFKRLKVKLKREIISIGDPSVMPEVKTGNRILPPDLKRWYEEGKKFVILDTRNDYELEYGKFRGAQDLGLKNFRNFKAALAPALENWKAEQVPVVMYCTGGIRCEKATAIAMDLGYDQVFQLEGGILKYFEECGGAFYDGSCFVFDERVSLTPNLEPIVSKSA